MKRAAAALLLLAVLEGGLYGIERSLWTDEVWVANSVLSPGLAGMFYYPGWLQTTPPLFLLLVRGAVHLFGLSNFSLRLVPLALALVATVLMLAVTRRQLSPAFAVLCCASMMFLSPVVIEYSHTLKQYSGEMAASALILLLTVLYLENPSRRRFYWLAGSFVLALPLAYSAVFLLPGVAMAIYSRRTVLLGSIAAGVLAILYAFFIRPNTSPLLRAFWMTYEQPATRGLLAALFICIVAMILIRTPIMLAAALPCLLLAAANALQWYPNSPRTRLFALPCFCLVVAMAAEHVLGRRRIVSAAAWIFAVILVSSAAWKQVSQHRGRPVEDFAGAVAFLGEQVAAQDLVLVHASVKEGIKLYAVMDSWDHPPIYGDTGRPCCLRDHSEIGSVADDLDRKVPKAFRGRIWLVYSTRLSHWGYVGVDESKLWRNYFAEKGCTHGPDLALPGLAIAAVDCQALE